MAHGTPSSIDEMPEYLRLVRGGRPPSPELIAEMRHIVAKDVTRIIGIPLAPQFSSLSVSKYFDAATAALPPGITIEPIHSYFDHPLLLDGFAERLSAAAPHADEDVVFTAHSLPVRVIASGDPYANEVAGTARGVATRCHLAQYQLAYQSAGRTPEPWIGPDINELIRKRTAEGARHFLVVPIGFVCDHTEILFDIDIQAQATARAQDASLRRTESLNSTPTFIAALESLVREKL